MDIPNDDTRVTRLRVRYRRGPSLARDHIQTMGWPMPGQNSVRELILKELGSDRRARQMFRLQDIMILVKFPIVFIENLPSTSPSIQPACSCA